MKHVYFFAALSLSTALAQTPSPYIKPGGVGQAPAAPTASCPTQNGVTLPPRCWVGQRILFLPAPQNLQSYGYQSFHLPNDEYLNPLPYKEYVGKIGVIQSIKLNATAPEVVIKLVGQDKTVVGQAILNTLAGVVFLKDLDFARKSLIGKPLWLRSTGLVTVDSTGTKFGSVMTGRFAKVTVTDVVAGTSEDYPIRIIAKTSDGRIGFSDVSWNATNTSPALAEAYGFKANFFTSNPRTLYKFSEPQWKAIGAYKVIVGMSKEAVLLAWDREPDKVNTTTTGNLRQEQWVYDGGSSSKTRYVYFSGGLVTSIQD